MNILTVEQRLALYISGKSLDNQRLIKSISNRFSFYMKSVHHKSVQDVDQFYFTSFHKQLKIQGGLRNGTINCYMFNLKSLLKEITGLDLKFKSEKVEPYANPSIILKDDLFKILRYLKRMKSQFGASKPKLLRDSIIFEILFATGLRKSELLRITHSDIKKESGRYYFIAKTKGSKEDVKFLSDDLVDDILNLKSIEGKTDEDLIFTNYHHGHLNSNNLLSNGALNKILNYYHDLIIGDKGKVTVHGIRNCSAAHLHSITKDILDVKEHLGHAKLETTELYLSRVRRKNKDYMDKMYQSLRECTTSS